MNTVTERRPLPRPVRRATLFGVFVGLALGVVYAVGGLVVDLRGPGLNAGTALAFLALVGMPLLFGATGLLLGAIGYTLRRQ